MMPHFGSVQVCREASESIAQKLSVSQPTGLFQVGLVRRPTVPVRSGVAARTRPIAAAGRGVCRNIHAPLFAWRRRALCRSASSHIAAKPGAIRLPLPRCLPPRIDDAILFPVSRCAGNSPRVLPPFRPPAHKGSKPYPHRPVLAASRHESAYSIFPFPSQSIPAPCLPAKFLLSFSCLLRCVIGKNDLVPRESYNNDIAAIRRIRQQLPALLPMTLPHFVCIIRQRAADFHPLLCRIVPDPIIKPLPFFGCRQHPLLCIVP